jgi:DNA-binding transcriptional MerR regulator
MAMEFVPKKLYYKIREVCEIIKVEAHVLRFWETEFPSLAPPKSKSGQRTYRPKDIELLLHIRKLLYEEGYTIAGARKQLNVRNAASFVKPPSMPMKMDEPLLEPKKNKVLEPGSLMEDRLSSIKDKQIIESEDSERLEPKVLEVVPEGIVDKEKMSVPAGNPEEVKPSSARLKRVQAELENILTLLDRE